MVAIDHQAELKRAGANITGWWSRILFFTRRYPLGAVGAAIVALFVFTAVFADFIAPVDPTTTNSKYSLAPPSAMFWLGADFRAATCTAASSRRAHLAGRRRRRDGPGRGDRHQHRPGQRLSRRLVRSPRAAPARHHAVAAAARDGHRHGGLARAVDEEHHLRDRHPLVPTVARVVRSNTLSLREQPFVEAARAVGMGEVRIAVRHVLPNTLAPLIVLATAQLGSAILVEASLSFLGLGIPEPHPSWGRMLSESAAEYVRTAPWLVIFPGVAISLTVFGTNLLGDALRDILDRVSVHDATARSRRPRYLVLYAARHRQGGRRRRFRRRLG
jgi:peptide/nickel transport system permease protein